MLPMLLLLPMLPMSPTAELVFLIVKAWNPALVQPSHYWPQPLNTDLPATLLILQGCESHKA